MNNGKNIFETVDYRGEPIIFEKAKWDEKRGRHPELNKNAFLKCIERAIIDPDEVWEDYEDRQHKRCYYKKYSALSYAKVVVWITHNPARIVTAYEISRIKESSYPEIKRVR